MEENRISPLLAIKCSQEVKKGVVSEECFCISIFSTIFTKSKSVQVILFQLFSCKICFKLFDTSLIDVQYKNFPPLLIKLCTNESSKERLTSCSLILFSLDDSVYDLKCGWKGR